LKPVFKATNVNLQNLETGCYVVGNKIIRCQTFHSYPTSYPSAGTSEAQTGWAYQPGWVYKVDDNPACSSTHVADELDKWMQTWHLREQLNRILGT